MSKKIGCEKTRFFSKILPKNENGCMNWSAGFNEKNYGVFHIKLSSGWHTIKAHRYSYLIYFGEIPRNMCVLHKCDNSKCVNPDHLFLGSQFENIKDMFSKNRNSPLDKGEKHNHAKLKINEVINIRKRLDNKENASLLCKEFCISKANLYAIKNYKIWKNV